MPLTTAKAKNRYICLTLVSIQFKHHVAQHGQPACSLFYFHDRAGWLPPLSPGGQKWSSHKDTESKTHHYATDK